jgi:hypothetical protein
MQPVKINNYIRKDWLEQAMVYSGWFLLYKNYMGILRTNEIENATYISMFDFSNKVGFKPTQSVYEYYFKTNGGTIEI